MRQTIKSIVVLTCFILSLWFIHFLFGTVVEQQIALSHITIIIVFMWLLSTIIDQVFIFGVKKIVDYVRIIYLTLGYASLYLMMYINIEYGQTIMKAKPLSLTELSWLSTLFFVILLIISFDLTYWLNQKLLGKTNYHEQYY